MLQAVLHAAARRTDDLISSDNAYFSNAGVPTAMIFVAYQLGLHNYCEAMRIDNFMLGVLLLSDTLSSLCFG